MSLPILTLRICGTVTTLQPLRRFVGKMQPSDERRGASIRVLFVLISLSLWTAWTALAAETGFPTFVDVAEKVGITLMNICGGAAKDYILEANGNGAAFFDYDNDGDVD